jgi:uncharacterized protein YukE
MADVGILGGDAVRGNPNGLATVARFLSDTAHEIDDVRRLMERDQLYASWNGAAAEAFRQYLKETPDDLDKAARSYRLASETVNTYSHRLRDAHDRAQYLADRLAALQSQAAGLDGRIRTAHTLIDNARRDYTRATPQTKAHALQILHQRQRDLQSLSGQRNGVQGQIDDVRRQAAQNRHDLDASARWAQDQLHEASRRGIRNNVFTWAHRRPWVEGIGKTLIDALEFPSKLADYIRDPSWAKLSALLDNLGAALDVLAFVGCVVLIAVTGGAGIALVPEIYAGVRMAHVAIDATKLGVDSYRKFGLHDPKVSYADLELDAVGLGLDVVGAKNADGALKTHWARALHDPDMSKSWKTWAATIVMVNHGDDRITKAALKQKTIKYVIGHAADIGPAPFLEDQLKDIINDYNPVLGQTKSWTNANSLLHSAENVVKHSITIPAKFLSIDPTKLVAEAR